jgi:hypothetical protein
VWMGQGKIRMMVGFTIIFITNLQSYHIACTRRCRFWSWPSPPV